MQNNHFETTEQKIAPPPPFYATPLDGNDTQNRLIKTHHQYIDHKCRKNIADIPIIKVSCMSNYMCMQRGDFFDQEYILDRIDPEITQLYLGFEILNKVDITSWN